MDQVNDRREHSTGTPEDELSASADYRNDPHEAHLNKQTELIALTS